jgi:hypothetical protein
LPTVVLASYNGDEFLRLNGVGFEGSQARISWTVDAATAAKDLGRLPSGGDIGEFGAVASLPSEAERKQLPGDLIPLLTSLFDVARSADRLKPILSSRVICRLYYSGERQLPTIEDPRCAALVLDSNALAMWFYMEGTGDISWPLFDWSSSRERAPDEQRIAAPLRALEALRSELRGAGMFEPEHSARLQQSLRAMTAALPIARVTIVESASVFPLPKGDLYLINAPYPIFLIREGRELRIAGVFLAGG